MKERQVLERLRNVMNEVHSLAEGVFELLDLNDEPDDVPVNNAEFEKHWLKIEETFNWNRVAAAMKAVGWEWTYLGGPPNTTEMKETAKYVCRDAWESKTGVGTGGFLAQYIKADDDWPEMLRLQFIFEETESA